jgi:hypothetical protein
MICLEGSALRVVQFPACGVSAAGHELHENKENQ